MAHDDEPDGAPRKASSPWSPAEHPRRGETDASHTHRPMSLVEQRRQQARTRDGHSEDVLEQEELHDEAQEEKRQPASKTSRKVAAEPQSGDAGVGNNEPQPKARRPASLVEQRRQQARRRVGGDGGGSGDDDDDDDDEGVRHDDDDGEEGRARREDKQPKHNAPSSPLPAEVSSNNKKAESRPLSLVERRRREQRSRAGAEDEL